MGKLSNIRDKYVIWHANTFPILPVEEGPIVREEVYFSGRVQKVGFRLEVETLANRLGLVGFAENLKDGEVLIEVQGTEKQIDYLIDCMCSLKRASVSSIKRKRINVLQEESSFYAKF